MDSQLHGYNEKTIVWFTQIYFYLLNLWYNPHPYLKGLPNIVYIVFAYNFAGKVQQKGDKCGSDPTGNELGGYGVCAKGLKCENNKMNLGGPSTCVDKNEKGEGIFYKLNTLALEMICGKLH